jgi:hypothetical protein
MEKGYNLHPRNKKLILDDELGKKSAAMFMTGIELLHVTLTTC